MLSIGEIKQFIDEDAVSEKKLYAKKGQKYYDGFHDINGYRLFFFIFLAFAKTSFRR